MSSEAAAPAPEVLSLQGERAPSPRAGAARAELAALPTLQLAFEGPAATLELHVVDATSKQPVPEAAIRLSAQRRTPPAEAGEEELVEWQELTALGNPPLTDGGGRISFRAPAGRILSAEISGTWVRTEQRPHELAILAPEELRTDVIEVATEEDLHCFGEVFDASTAAPLADVEIQLERRPSIEPIAISDARGRFELRTNSWESRKASASKRGFLPLAFTVDEQHDSESRPQRLELARAATIQGYYRGCDDQPVAEGSLRFWTRSGFAAHVYPREDGWFEADSLPTGEAVDVDLELGHRPMSRSVASVVLAPGELRRIDWKLPPVLALHGIVLDELGAPVPGCELALYSGGSSDLRCLGVTRALDERDNATSDEEGRFTFTKASQGDWVVALLRLQGRHAFLRDPYSWNVPLAAQNVTVSAREPEPVVLHCWVRAAIAGRVVDAQDQPVPRARLHVHLAGCAAGIERWAAADGTFSVPVPGPDTFEIRVVDNGWFLDSETITAHGGEHDLVIKLQRSPVMRVRVVDESTHAPVRAQVFGVAMRTDSVIWMGDQDAERPGQLVSPCAAGTYRLFARGSDGRCGTLDDVVVDADSSAREWRVPVAPAQHALVHSSSAGGPIEVQFSWNGIPIDHEEILKGSKIPISIPTGTLGAKYRREEPLGDWQTLDTLIDDARLVEIDLRFP